MFQISQSGKTNWNIIDTFVNSNHPFLPLYITWYYETQSSTNNIKGWLKLLASSNSALGFRKSWIAKNGKRRRICLLILNNVVVSSNIASAEQRLRKHKYSQRKCRIRTFYFCNTWRHWEFIRSNICYGLTLKHASVGRFRNGVDMRRHFMPLLAPVHLDDVLRVYGEVFVWVYDHTEESWVSLHRQKQTKGGKKINLTSGQLIWVFKKSWQTA